MDGAQLSTVIPFALIPLYGVALSALVWARRRSPRVAERTATVWRYELAITTWVLALPGLVAAAWGILVGFGLLLFPLGIAVGVVATRVAGGRVSHSYALPLIFVGIVDLVAVAPLIGTLDSRNLHVADVAWAAVAAVYLFVATANAIRIFRRGRNASRAKRKAAAAMVPEHRDPSPTPGAFEPPRDLFVALSTRSR